MRKIVASLASLSLLFMGLAPSASAVSTSTDFLNSLVQLPEANSTTYQREYFNHWTDDDKDGCDTREEVLISESKIKSKTGSGCSVLSGGWLSLYDNKVVTKASDLDIDHMVPLKEAWESGASRWTFKEREMFANDLEFAGSLIAVTASSNRSKGDKDPAQWTPTHKAFHCDYAVNWISVKYRWSLTVDAVEFTALKKLLSSCSPAKSFSLPSQVPTTSNPYPTVTPTATPTPTAIATSSPEPTASPAPTPVTPKFGSDMFPGVFSVKAEVSDRIQAGKSLPVTLTLTDLYGKFVPDAYAKYSHSNVPEVTVGPSDASGVIKFSIPVDLNTYNLLLVFKSGFGTAVKFVIVDKAVSPSPIPSPSPSQTATPSQIPSPAPSGDTTTYRLVTPGAFCARDEAGTTGRSSSGKFYTCKTSSTENRLRWRP